MSFAAVVREHADAAAAGAEDATAHRGCTSTHDRPCDDPSPSDAADAADDVGEIIFG